jgi:hypothetical protein
MIRGPLRDRATAAEPSDDCTRAALLSMRVYLIQKLRARARVELKNRGVGTLTNA